MSGDGAPRVVVRAESDLSVHDRATVIDGLIEHNRERGFVWAHAPLNVLARAADGRVVGGLLGDVNLGWLFVAALWVDAGHRGTGVGSALLREAEARARERGCVGVYLDTYSFQARPFYERLGYELFGELGDCPPGGAKYYLRKRLAPPAADAGAATDASWTR